MKHCQKHPDDFKSVNPECLFLSTVAHSLDHYFFETNLEDPLWLDYDKVSPDIHHLVDVMRVGRVCFTEDLPGILFTRKMKDSKELFYRDVYREAVKIDLRLANEMDTAIIK